MFEKEEKELPVITNWDELQSCMFAEKRWVNPKSVDISKSYEKGDFLRVFCNHDGEWCQAVFGLNGCKIYEDHEKE